MAPENRKTPGDFDKFRFEIEKMHSHFYYKNIEKLRLPLFEGPKMGILRLKMWYKCGFTGLNLE